MTPMPMGAPVPAMPPQMPPMPSPEQLEEDRLIAEACSWEEIAGVLHSDDRRNYTVDVETDATAFEDIETEKQQRIEYLRAMTEMMQVWVPAIQGNPSLAPLGKELAIFGSGAFKPGRQFEEQLGDAFDQIKNMPPQPNPEAEKLKAEAEREQQKFMMEAQARQQEAAAKERDRQQEALFKEKDYALKERSMMADLAFKEKDLQFKEAELGLKMQDAQMNRAMAAEQAIADRETRAADRQARDEDRQAAREDRAFDRQHREREFALKGEEIAFKREESRQRLGMDQAEQHARRALEADQVKGEGGKTARAEIEDGVAQQIQQLAAHFAASMEQLSSNQVQIVGVLQDIRANQDEMTDAVTKVVGHMTAPRKVARDPKSGRAVGVEVGASEGDLKTMLDQLAKGGRAVTRDPKTNRIEAF